MVNANLSRRKGIHTRLYTGSMSKDIVYSHTHIVGGGKKTHTHIFTDGNKSRSDCTVQSDLDPCRPLF